MPSVSIQDILDQQWHDNVKARVLDPKQTNMYVPSKKNAPRLRSQESIHATWKLESCRAIQNSKWTSRCVVDAKPNHKDCCVK